MDYKEKEELLRSIIDNHFSYIDKDIDRWYNSLNRLISSSMTPTELIENGNIDVLLDYVKRVKS